MRAADLSANFIGEEYNYLSNMVAMFSLLAYSKMCLYV
jgi:hypothetical protein